MHLGSVVAPYNRVDQHHAAGVDVVARLGPQLCPVNRVVQHPYPPGAIRDQRIMAGRGPFLSPSTTRYAGRGRLLKGPIADRERATNTP